MTLLLAIVSFIILALWPLPIFIAECLGHAFPLTHGMLAAFMNGARTIDELLVIGIIAMLSASIYGVNRIVWSALVGLTAS